MTKPFDAEAMAREFVTTVRAASGLGVVFDDDKFIYSQAGAIQHVAAALQSLHDAHEAEVKALRKALEQLLFEDSDTPENAYLRHRLEARAALASKEPDR